MNVGFERIHPIPTYPVGTNAQTYAGLSWYSNANVVKAFKRELKSTLRESQFGRCCYCRRLLPPDNYTVHLEHFVDQASHAEHRFEIRNLALSCPTCNGKKNAYFISWSTRYKRMKKLQHSNQTPVLAMALVPGTPFPTLAQHFRWVNPYVHDYSEHVSLVRGWVFSGRTNEGRRTVKGLRLNDLADLERRALTERLHARGGRLSMLIGTIYEFNHHRAQDIALAVAAVLERRRKAKAVPAQQAPD